MDGVVTRSAFLGYPQEAPSDHVPRKYVQSAFQPLKYIVRLLPGNSLSRYNPGFPPK
jgi:hypothetical protein